VAIALDQLLGSNTAGASITTGAAAAAGSRLFYICEDFSTSLAITGFSASGGLTWVVDRAKPADSNNVNVIVASADAPSGLASSTTITPTLTGGTVTTAVLFSFTGIAGGASGYLTGTPPNPVTTFSPSSWTTPSLTTADADALILGAVGHDGTTPFSSTPTSGSELYDIHNSGTTQTLTAVYRIVSSINAYTTAGNWSTTGSEQRAATVAYKAATGGGNTYTPSGSGVIGP
jgi:hypothetical protein